MTDALDVKKSRPAPGERVMLRVEFETENQGTLRVVLTMNDLQVPGGHPVERMVREGPPAFIENPSRHWDHPQDPITFRGTVKPGCEHMARKVLGLR
jgi:hypothetical protein